ncbi:DUF535 family protein [Geopsychrobacter electrodiphilus]|uniref:DUF535 family protein n=1 Tax=Geopsychrobacter electrodiphilus TaxID=225196 RepID=UPI0005260F0B
MARIIHPAENAHYKFKRVRFLLRSLLYRRVLKQMFFLFQEERLRTLPEKHRELLDKTLRPYQIANSSARVRAQRVEEHYRLLLRRYPNLIEPLFLESGIELGRYPDNFNRVILRYDGVFRREGELVLSVVDEAGKRLYSCAFSLAGTAEQLHLIIGSVQGPEPAVDQAQEKVRIMTKGAYGLRPKSLVVLGVLMIAKALGAEQVMAVKKNAHVFQAKRYSKKQKGKVQLDYDELWSEFEARDVDSNFVLLPQLTRKPLEEIVSKKRSMYRRRYEWLDTFAANIYSLFGTVTG